MPGTPGGPRWLGRARRELDEATARLQERTAQLASALADAGEWRTVFETLPQIVWITRPDGWHVHFNQPWMDFTGLTLEESLGHGWNPPFHPDDRGPAAARWEQATTTGEPYEIEYRLRRHDGTYRWMLGRAMPMRDGDGRITKWVGTCTDIEDLKAAEARLAAQAQLLDQTRDAIVVLDLDRRVRYWNRGAERISGWSPDEATGRLLDELVGADIAQVEQTLEVLQRDGEWDGEFVHVTRDGRERILEGRWTLLHGDDGEPQGALAVNTDITEAKGVEQALIRELERKATEDPLTGLPNREALTVRLEEALALHGSRDGALTLLLCDLDDFKVVNDALGHLAGDQVLVEVASRLRDAVRDDDLVARFGGDEFAILLEHADEEAVDALTRRLLAVVPRPVYLDTDQPVEVGLSIGVARATRLHDAATLLRDADATLYHAKHEGKRRVERFDDRLRHAVLDRLTLPRDLRAGLARDEVSCVFQPEVDLATGALFGHEALVRWQHPDRGLLGPERFVPVAETSGLIGELFARVLEVSLRAHDRWTRVSGVRGAVSVNLSARQLDDPSTPGAVAVALTRSGVAATDLWLEVTETALSNVGSLTTLTALHELGVHLAIDDFGTGWSSLSRLADFPFDLLKIDRSFIARLTPGNRTEHMVRATIVMAHALGMQTVAEGVETEAQRDTLAAMGCDFGQGYLFARPGPADEAMTHVGADGRWVGPGSSTAWQRGSASST